MSGSFRSIPAETVFHASGAVMTGVMCAGIRSDAGGIPVIKRNMVVEADKIL